MFVFMKGLRAHRAQARQDMKERCRSLLSDTFWEHARASRREARLACRAFRQAAQSQFLGQHKDKSTRKQEVEIV